MISTASQQMVTDVLASLPEIRAMNAVIGAPVREARRVRKRVTVRRAVAAFKAREPERYGEIRTDAKRRQLEHLARSTAEDPAGAQAADDYRAWLLGHNGFVCAYCGEPATKPNRTTDHILALSKGGKHTPANLVPCCRRCNSLKGDRPAEKAPKVAAFLQPAKIPALPVPLPQACLDVS